MTKAFPSNVNDQTKGMDLRDWFAGQVFMGVHSSIASMTKEEYAELEYRKNVANSKQLLATMCYEMADAMIAARKGGES